MIFKAAKPSELADAVEFLVSLSLDRRIFAFYGEMGVGKTTMIKKAVKALGTQDEVTSPTFSIVNEYSDAEERPLYHFDFYRLQSEEEAFDIGYEEYFYSGNLCFIEWPEKIDSLIPPDAVKLFLTDQGEYRTIEFKVPS